MTRLKVKNGVTARFGVGLFAWATLLSGCSFKSLDHLQQGEPAKQSGIDQQSAIAGKGATTEQLGGAASGGSGSLPSSVTDAVSGGTSSDLLLSSVQTAQGGTASAVSPAETGGTGLPVDSTGGLTSTTIANGAGGNLQSTLAATGGVVEGGSTSLGGTSSLGGSAVALGGTSSSASPNFGGTAGTTVVSTGGAPTMMYGILNQSCLGGLECPGGSSCCDQMEVPSEEFTMGVDKSTDADAQPDEAPPHPATLDAFFMDKFEVTVGRFRKFVQAFDGNKPVIDAGAHPRIAQSGWQQSYGAFVPSSKGELKNSLKCDSNFQTWTETSGVRDSMPINCVNWYVAFAFCIWDGGRLPTEAEWEMAASGGTSHRRFPWGNANPDPAKHAAMGCTGDGASGCASTDLLAVGSRVEGANRWGHLDLAGNLWEWTLDYFDSTYYAAVGNCANCCNLEEQPYKSIRGGSFYEDAKKLRVTFRTSKAPDNRSPYAGFRCVRSR